MNNRYLWRAKRIDNGEWVEGNLIYSEDIDDNYKAIIIPISNSTMFTRSGSKGYLGFEEWQRVDPSTICQCTGLKDKNGKLIWENDILNSGNLVVAWREKFASYCLTKKGWMYQHFFGEAVDACDCEVIGNIFDNPELLEVGK